MAYTELVANIGFKFQGAGELKQLEETLKSVADLAKEISGSLGGSGSRSGLGPLGKKLAAFGAEIDSFKATGFAGIRSQLRTITATSSSWEEFGGAVGKMAGRILPVVGLVANVASAASDLAINLTRAAIQSAQLHNSQSISALGGGSKASNVAALARMYELMSFQPAMPASSTKPLLRNSTRALQKERRRRGYPAWGLARPIRAAKFETQPKS